MGNILLRVLSITLTTVFHEHNNEGWNDLQSCGAVSEFVLEEGFRLVSVEFSRCCDIWINFAGGRM